VLPIPHTFQELPPSFSIDNNCIVCWWPGTPRPEKGQDIMQRLVSVNEPDACKFLIVASEESGLIATLGGPQIQLVGRLNDTDYKRWMATSDIILLPYNPQIYHCRSSGIFVESIVAGKIPLVCAGSWMSGELEVFHLNELDFDWESPGVFNRMLKLLADVEVKNKIARMRCDFTSYHTQSRYLKTLGELASLSGI
jgi:hypothetical protein